MAGLNLARTGAYEQLVAAGYEAVQYSVAMQRPNVEGFNRADGSSWTTGAELGSGPGRHRRAAGRGVTGAGPGGEARNGYATWRARLQGIDRGKLRPGS